MRIKRKNLFKSLLLCICFIFILSSIFLTYVNADSYGNNVQSSSTNVIQSGSYIYFSSGESLYKVNIKTKKTTRILTMKYTYELGGVNVYNGYVYFIRYKGGSGNMVPYIYRVKTNGTSLKKLAKGKNIQIYNGKIYFLRYQFYNDDESTIQPLGIYRMSTNGTKVTVIKELYLIEKFIVKGSYIYYQSSDDYWDSSVYRISTSGKYNKCLYYDKSSSIFDISSKYLYDFTPSDNKGNYSAYKYNLSSKSWSKIISCENTFCVKDGWLYYSVYKNNYTYLYKINISTKKKVYLTKANFITNVKVTSSYIIYDCITNKSLSEHNYIHTRMMNIKGSNSKTIAKYYLP